jgi:hypothetical protein
MSIIGLGSTLRYLWFEATENLAGCWVGILILEDDP